MHSPAHSRTQQVHTLVQGTRAHRGYFHVNKQNRTHLDIWFRHLSEQLLQCKLFTPPEKALYLRLICGSADVWLR